MAIQNPPHANHSLVNQHTLYLGLTGSGKSQALKQQSRIPENGARVVLFDPSRDHSKGVHYYDDRAEFALALAEADASGKGFRIGYDGVRDEHIYDWWCACLLAILDGRKLTYAITEELAAVSANAGRAMEHHRFLLNEGRKYGLVYHAATQRPSEISKSVYDNMEIIYFGMQSPRLQKMFCTNYGMNFDELARLQPLEFIRWQQGKMEFIKLSYKK